jgi:calmodulin
VSKKSRREKKDPVIITSSAPEDSLNDHGSDEVLTPLKRSLSRHGSSQRIQRHEKRRTTRAWARGACKESVAASLQEAVTALGHQHHLHFESTDEKIEHLAFTRIAGSNKDEISYRDLIPTMKSMGYVDVQEAWLSEVCTTLLKVCTTLLKDVSSINFDQFQTIVEAYHDRHLLELENDFKLQDLDGSGKIDAGEIALALDRCGITVVPGIVKELLHEICQSEDKTSVGMEEYVLLREIIQYRGGFTLKEVGVMSELHTRFNANGSGLLCERELAQAMLWLGFPSEEQQSDGHFRHIALEGMSPELTAGGLDLLAFLRVMRKRREYDITCFQHGFGEYVNAAGYVTSDMGVNVIRKLGYCTASLACVEEYAAAVGIDHQGTLFFDDMWRILETFRKFEGFLKSEIEDFREVFEKNDWDNSGAIGMVELGGVMRAMGYRVDVGTQQQLMDEVDLDNSGEIDFDEFLKVMRRYREDEIHALESAFSSCKNSGKLCSLEIRCLLPALGYDQLEPDQPDC